jgi:hypothetical protein
MKYIKTFESFSFNENAGAELPEEAKAKIETDITAEVEKLSPEKLEEVKAQLEEFASKHGLTLEDLQDVKKVEAIVMEHAETNESWLGDKWNQFKSWIGGFLFKLGLGGLVSTIIGAAVASGVLDYQGFSDEAAGKIMGPYVATAFGVSFLAIIVGHFTSSKADKAWQAEMGKSANRARIGNRF